MALQSEPARGVLQSLVTDLLGSVVDSEDDARLSAHKTRWEPPRFELWAEETHSAPDNRSRDALIIPSQVMMHNRHLLMFASRFRPALLRVGHN